MKVGHTAPVAVALVPVEAPATNPERVTCRPPTIAPLPGTRGLASTLAVCVGDLCWENYPQGTSLVSVAAGTDGSLYAVSSDNAILRRDAAGWVPMCPPDSNVSWTGIAANGRDDVWVAGYRASGPFEEVVYRWDGRRWLRPERSMVAWPMIDGGAGADILIAGSLPSARRTLLGDADPAVYRWDGSSFTAERLDGLSYLGWLSVRGGEAWITGSTNAFASVAVHRTDAGWIAVAAPPGVHLGTIAADPAGGAFAGGSSSRIGTLTRCEDDGCRVVYQGDGDWLNVRGVANDGVVLDSGVYGPDGVSPLPPNAGLCGRSDQGPTYDVAADGQLYSACGPEIERLGATAWIPELSLSRHSAEAIGGGGANDLVVGGNGLAHLDGSSWTTVIEPTTYEKYGYVFFDHSFRWIRGAAPDDVILADLGPIGDFSALRWNGSSVAPLAVPAGAQLFDGADGSLALATIAAPDRWEVRRREPGGWSAPASLPISSEQATVGVWIAPSGEIWAAATWSPASCASSSSVLHVVGDIATAIPLGDWRVSAVVGDGAGGAWAWGGSSGCGGRNPIRTPGRVVHVASDGAVEDTGLEGSADLVLTTAGDAFVADSSGRTWRHRAADPVRAWQLVSTWSGALAALPDGSVWAGRWIGGHRAALLRYRPR